MASARVTRAIWSGLVDGSIAAAPAHRGLPGPGSASNVGERSRPIWARMRVPQRVINENELKTTKNRVKARRPLKPSGHGPEWWRAEEEEAWSRA